MCNQHSQCFYTAYVVSMKTSFTNSFRFLHTVVHAVSLIADIKLPNDKL